jgi:hypothetical protein
MQQTDGSLRIAARHDHAVEHYHISQGSTNDCGPHVVAMSVNFWQGHKKLDPAQVSREMNRPRLNAGFPPLIVRRIPNWATFPWGIVDMLRKHNLKARWQLGASEDAIHRALREDRLVLPIFGEPLRRRGWRWTGWSHIALLCGWNPTTETYWFVDSARVTAPTSRPRNEFMTLWRNLGRILIETL